MGTNISKNQMVAEDCQRYVNSLTHLRKEHSISLQANIDIYKPESLTFPEDAILLYEQCFDDSDGANPHLLRFKQKLEMRKKFQSKYIAELVYVNFQVMKGLCIEQLVSKVALQYSEVNLSILIQNKSIGQFRASGSVKSFSLPSSQAVVSLITCLSETLFLLRGFGVNHGFIMPENVLVYDSESRAPFFRLLDVSLISTFDK